MHFGRCAADWIPIPYIKISCVLLGHVGESPTRRAQTTCRRDRRFVVRARDMVSGDCCRDAVHEACSVDGHHVASSTSEAHLLKFIIVALTLSTGCAPYLNSGYGTGGGYATTTGSSASSGTYQQDVVINGVTIPPADAARAQIPAGRYWYDTRSGLWGREGMPVQGQTYPGLSFGRLAPDASHGTTYVVVNGRTLPVQEVAWLQQLLRVAYITPGSYWLDAQGNIGVEGGPVLVNLYAAARSNGGNGGGGGGDNFWSSRTGRGNESNGAGYVCTGGTCATYGM